MDMYGFSNPPTAQDLFRIDELLDLSNEELFTPSNNSSTTTNAAASTVLASTDTNQQHPPPQNPSTHSHNSHHSFTNSYSSDFTDLCVPSDDVAELEWLSRFVDDSFSDFPKNSLTGTLTVRSDMSFPGKARSKRSKAVNSTPNATSWTSSTETPVTGNSKVKRENHRQSSPTPEGGVRRCTHCASEKTPQWRTGPLGPKTLCNACGVRYKSGRLVPEYRPAASPTFVLTQHSNSHRKVLELRRQKEMMRQQQLQQQQQQEQIHRHQRDFEVC